MQRNKGITRRDFVTRSVKAGVALAAMPYIVPSRVFGANDRVGIGFIAAGRRARELFKDFAKVADAANAQVVAVSDLFKKRMDEVCGDKPWAKYQYYRELLQDKNVDAVIVAAPDHWHALASIHACQAGKDVYCEKPITLTVHEGRVMADAVRKHKRVFQCGSQQRSSEECRFGCELVRNGRIGKVHTVIGNNYPSPWECELPEQPVPEGLDWDAWCGQTTPRPFHKDLYLPRANPGWISFRPYSGGEMTGWGAHGLDIIQWALGMDESGPVEVWPEGPGLTAPVSFRYANGTVVKLEDSGPHGGGIFKGEGGTIMIDRGKYESTPKEIAKTPIGEKELHLYKSPNHMKNWIDCIRSREKPIADIETAHRSTTVCHLGNIARWTGRKLQWDPEKERFVNDDAANEFLQRPMRAPYALPEI
jgi:predicted dehydrogenase